MNQGWQSESTDGPKGAWGLLSFSLFLWLSTYLPAYLLCIYLSIDLSLLFLSFISLPIYLSTYLSIYLFVTCNFSYSHVPWIFGDQVVFWGFGVPGGPWYAYLWIYYGFPPSLCAQSKGVNKENPKRESGGQQGTEETHTNQKSRIKKTLVFQGNLSYNSSLVVI